MSNSQDKKPFDPMDHLMTIPGKGNKEYLEVKWRMVWFRLENPNGTIDTEEVEVDLDREFEEETNGTWNDKERKYNKVIKRGKGYARFRAVVSDGKGGRASGTKSENAAGFADFIEKAETGAIGRALAALGYGTQFAPEFEEGLTRIVDSPVNLPKSDESTSPSSSSKSQQQQQATQAQPVPLATKKTVTPAVPIQVEPRKEKMITSQQVEEIATRYDLFGHHEWNHLLEMKKLGEDTARWTTEQAFSFLTFTHAWEGSDQQKAWLKQKALDAQQEDIKRFRREYGDTAVVSLKSRIAGVKDTKSTDFTRGQADTLLGYLYTAQPTIALARVADPDFAIAKSFAGMTHPLDFYGSTDGDLEGYLKKLEEAQAKIAA